MIDLATWLALIMASCSAAHFLLNARLFHRAPRPVETAVEPVAQFPSVSVLIPARDEEAGLAETIRCVLASEGCGFELVVLDDHSQDQTAAIVRRFAAEDDRVRLAVGKPLPSGWCGKQFACFQLAQQARGDLLLFLDADVRLAPDAIRRMVALRQTHNVALLSGFPTQVVGTLAEALLIPLMHLVLLTYLPFRRMRATCRPSTSAGCGQMFLATRAAYERAGGHAAIRNSMHDGLTLPRAFRQAGLTTDVFDASDLARCRMYQGWRQTQKGVLKKRARGNRPATVDRALHRAFAGSLCGPKRAGRPPAGRVRLDPALGLAVPGDFFRTSNRDGGSFRSQLARNRPVSRVDLALRRVTMGGLRAAAARHTTGVAWSLLFAFTLNRSPEPGLQPKCQTSSSRC